MCRDNYQDPGTLLGPSARTTRRSPPERKRDAVRPGGLPRSRPAHDNAGAGEVRPGSVHLLRRSTTSVVCRPPTPTDQARKNFNGQLATRPSTEGARSEAVINSAGHNHLFKCLGRSPLRDPSDNDYKKEQLRIHVYQLKPQVLPILTYEAQGRWRLHDTALQATLVSETKKGNAILQG